MTGGRKWTAGRMDRPPHGRFWTTDHGHFLWTDKGGRRTIKSIKMRPEVDGWTDG